MIDGDAQRELSARANAVALVMRHGAVVITTFITLTTPTHWPRYAP
jgi:hypothetical protein